MVNQKEYKLAPSAGKNVDEERYEAVASTFASLEDVYKAIIEKSPQAQEAELLLELRDWFLRICDFDPQTGYPLPRGLCELLKDVNIAHTNRTSIPMDHLRRIIKHTGEAIKSLIERPRTKILRAHALLPIYAAREVDSASVQWLSRKPGRNLREKLAGKPYLKSVSRSMSLDTTENRLLKAFLSKFKQLLMLRSDAFAGQTEEITEQLLQTIQRWYQNDEVSEIGSWSNLPPNNTLLQDKNYRKLWDAWLWLQALDENIQADHKRLQCNWITILFWTILATLDELEHVRVMQQPCFFDYDKFDITSHLSIQAMLIPQLQKGLSFGKVESLAPDRGYAIASKDSGETVLCHVNDFESRIQFDQITTETLLSFSEQISEKGLVTKNIRIYEGPQTIHLEILNKSEFNISVGTKTVRINVGENSNVALYFEDGGDSKAGKSLCSLSSIRIITKQVVNFLFGASCQNVSKHLEPHANSNIKYKNVILDLCSTRPRFVADSGFEHKIPFRLARQSWNSKTAGETRLDLGYAEAVTLRPDVVTVSMLNLFSEGGDYPTGLLSNAAMAFVQNIYKYMEPESLTYLVPDSINEFSLENIRRSINFYFPGSVPLPRSVAVVFAWQASKSFIKSNFNDGDIVLVIENRAENISLTPLVGFISHDLLEAVPESKGVYWERHPSIAIKGDSAIDIAIRALDKNGCTLSKEMANLFGFEGLIDEINLLSWIDPDQRWYNLPSDIRELLRQEAINNSIRLDDIYKAINTLSGRCENKAVFLLPIGDSFKQPIEEHSFKWLGSAWSLTKGGQSLSQWQLRAKKKTESSGLGRDHLPEFWCDHLPELLFKDIVYSQNGWGYWGYFELVKHTTITPQKGTTVNIPIEESFMLPAGKTHYQFPLLQGAGGHALQYMAYLKSTAFPLIQDTLCRLTMTYTYGADEPYELQFIPHNPDEAGFKSLRVEWREQKQNETFRLLYPDFPPRHKWDDFESFLKKDGETSQLLEWIREKLQFDELFKVADYKKCIESHICNRREGLFEWGTTDTNGRYYCYVKSGQESIWCHSDYFCESVNTDDLKAGDQVYYDRRETDRGPRGNNITFSEICPEKLRINYKNQLDQRLSEVCERTIRGIFSLRFPALTVWNHTHSLSETDVPDGFRITMQNGIDACVELMGKSEFPKELSDEIFFFLCCIHKDAPINVSVKLTNILEEAKRDVIKLEHYYRHIAYAIGDAELEWQEYLLEKVMEFIKGKDAYRSVIGLQILSISLWRTEQLVFRFTEDELSVLYKQLFSSIKHDLENVIKVANRDKMTFVIMRLELLLAMIRVRGSEDEGIRFALSPEKNITKEFVKLIDEIIQKVCDAKLDMRSRISLGIDKPEAFRNTPDLLYALRMYLTGDSGANAIQVTGISDVNDED